ncbi:MAG: hypothetical protein H7256_14090 [Bdellovibrio sp.]|nr:hypothetical protein [Bdellovibrio sp.]
MINLKYIILASLLSSPTFAAYEFKVVSRPVGTTALTFMKNANVDEKYYNQLIDYAQLEKMAPLSTAALANVQPDDLRSLTIEEFNQLYARLSAGPMPLGDYSGYILQKPPVFNAIKKRILKQASLFPGFTSAMQVFTSTLGRSPEDALFEFVWKGKRFFPKDNLDQIETRTSFNLVSAGASKFTPDWISNKIPAGLGKSFIWAADKTSFLGLPMHVYCGISQVDTRRESIITDGSYGDDFSSYLKYTDEIVTRKGLNITEEYRMVRPGLYIGKAYSNKLFLFNVALEISGDTPSNQTVGSCFDGKTTR